MIKEKIRGALGKALGKLNSLGKKKLIALIVASATAVTALTAGGVTLAKYAKEINNDKDVSAKKFYFESDLLKAGGAEYTLGFNTISFNLMNYVDTLRTSEVDIDYTVSIKCDGNLVTEDKTGTISNGTGETPTQNSVTIEYKNLELGKTYTVEANATSPYTKKISATFTVPSVLPHITYSVENTEYVTYLRVNTGDYSGNVKLTWQDGYLPDNSHEALTYADATSKSHTATLKAKSVYEFSFYKPTKNTPFEETEFKAVPAAVTPSNVFDGKEFVPETQNIPAGKDNGVWSDDVKWSYSKITDGSFNYDTGRYSSKSDQDGAIMYGTLDLGGTYSLTDIKFYYYKGKFQSTSELPQGITDYVYANFVHAAGVNYRIEVYRDGEWITVIENISPQELYNNYTNTTVTDPYVYFNLGGVKAEKIRIYAEAAPDATQSYKNAVSWYEVECSGYQISALAAE